MANMKHENSEVVLEAAHELAITSEITDIAKTYVAASLGDDQNCCFHTTSAAIIFGRRDTNQIIVFAPQTPGEIPIKEIHESGILAAGFSPTQKTKITSVRSISDAFHHLGLT